MTARMRLSATTDDYRAALSGEGEFLSLGYEWSDKPHRLVYDLCGEVDALKAELQSIRRATIEDCARVADDHFTRLDKNGFVEHGSQCLDHRCNESIAKAIACSQLAYVRESSIRVPCYERT